MPLSYNPSDGARPDGFWGPKYLSNRDITGQAPIDKTTFPGVYVTSACHPDGVYDRDSFETCFSNLIAVGFRRLVIDLYWDASNGFFGLCPVEVPDIGNNTVSAQANAEMTSPPTLTPRSVFEYVQDSFARRQDQSVNATSSNTTSSGGGGVTSTAAPSPSSDVTTSDGPTGATLINLGPFRCSPDLDFGSIIDIIEDYVDSSSDGPAATLQILQFNLHSARSAADPEGAPQNISSEALPTTQELVGWRFANEMGAQLYSPRDLEADRSNMNLSWYEVRVQERLPMTGYFHTTTSSSGVVSTDDGWPSELYLLLTSLRRLILTWGVIDSEMEGYNFTGDSRHVFAPGILSESRDLGQDSEGVVTSGCFYSDRDKDPAQVNNTWAIAALNNSRSASQSFLQNITSCGVSPLLNDTLNGQSAASAYLDYQRYVESTIIGWADGEPRNGSSPGVDADRDQDQFRCVVIDSTDNYRGKWRVVSCQGQYRAACRIGGQPYNWRLTRTETDFTGAPESCPEGSSFDVPVSQLENTYLYEHILADTENQSDSSLQRGVWINLNALDEMNCWVTTGPNGTCRYQRDSQQERNRQVLIPTIAALIILILTALTILVKCNVNRRNSKRHRIGPGGWEYEGVPS
ncbi:uncharacterized protein HMPREF1541_07381 [Cyphellophora europaea CBS 101466]|uniref:Maintenance of telomere capping protein 6 n=1 Tax=Cyphellophora europaea (strain CBS 101466) TaxID=1220924 RepID=W2RPX6_CYPE1|nr:uncharacterized protein HMPREF1541_07381 [Cyphellophora europaea CBS 101466]ETN37758.1 hypothetical protein HMPREF1541_07381 [Cyphellophora europaea CBS 101466]